jgi:TolB-like protein/Tfp pilus assembly protein PilF
LRRVFGETPGSHRYIVTIPGRGYRFVANVRVGDSVAKPAEKSSVVPPNGTTEPGFPIEAWPVTQAATARNRHPTMIALALLLTGALIVAGVSVRRARENPLSALTATSLPPVPALPTKSIAVLPFENLSPDPENAYLATGIQDEILSNLARISDLKVISRTSANLYKTGGPRNALEIGQQLGVAHLLEGSVQRSDKRLRIHAQLIDTRTDSHLWAQTYDRDLADVLTIQSEIAQTIADQLQVKISERERASIAQPATRDLVANDLYRQALVLEFRLPEHENHLKAVSLLEQAVARDPRFFLAYCALGQMHLRLYDRGHDHTVARREMVEAAIQKATELEPDAGEVHLVRGKYLYLDVRDYDRARTELALARRNIPNNPSVYNDIAMIDWRQGRWTESLKSFDHALELDPRNPQILIQAAATYEVMRRYGDAAPLYHRAVTVAPHNYWARMDAAGLPIDERADTRPLRTELNAILAEEPDAESKIADNLFWCAIFERDVAAADRALAAIPPEGMAETPELVWPREWYVGYVARTFNRPEAARAAFEATRVILKKLVSEQPNHSSAWSLLGRVEASLGRKEEAIKAGLRACEAWPLSREPTSGLRPLLDLAKIYAWVGEKDLALQQLAKSAEQTLYLTYGHLKLSPEWDPLRDDPRFEKIVGSLAPKADGEPR